MFLPFLRSHLAQYPDRLNLFADVSVLRIKLLCSVTVVLQCGLFAMGWKLSDFNRDLLALPLVLLRVLILASCTRAILLILKGNKRLLVVLLSLLFTASCSIILLVFAARGELRVSTSLQCFLCMVSLAVKRLAYKRRATLPWEPTPREPTPRTPPDSNASARAQVSRSQSEKNSEPSSSSECHSAAHLEGSSWAGEGSDQWVEVVEVGVDEKCAAD